MTDKPIEIKVWIKRGGMMIRSDALDIEDSDHVYNQILAQGARPELYGYFHPYAEMFLGVHRNELIEEIIQLRKDVTFWMSIA